MVIFHSLFQKISSVGATFALGIFVFHWGIFGLLLLPERAEALVVETLPGSVVTTLPGSTIVVTGDITRDATLTPKEMGLDVIGWMLAKLVIQEVVNEMRSLIEQGFFGDLMFLVDPQAFARKIAQDITNSLIGELESMGIADPIKQALVRVLARTHGKFSNYAASTVGEVLTYPNAFYRSTFYDSGGWSGFLAYSTMPENSYIGQAFMIAEENERRVWEAQQTINDELGWGNGILSMPGDCLQTVGVDSNGDGRVNADDGCVSWERVNPGTLIAGEMSKAIGSRVGSLEDADEIEEYLSAALYEVVAAVVNAGFEVARNTVRSTVRRAVTGSSDPYYGNSYYSPSGSGYSYSSGYPSPSSGGVRSADLVTRLYEETAELDEILVLVDKLEHGRDRAEQILSITESVLEDTAESARYERLHGRTMGLISLDDLSVIHDDAEILWALAEDTLSQLDMSSVSYLESSYFPGLSYLYDRAASTQTLSEVEKVMQDYAEFKTEHARSYVMIETLTSVISSSLVDDDTLGEMDDLAGIRDTVLENHQRYIDLVENEYVGRGL
jgi:hypothetical protein